MIAIRPNGIVDLRLISCFRRHVAWVLEYCEGNVNWAADELEVDRVTLYRWLKKWARGEQVKPHFGYERAAAGEETT